MSAQPDQPLWQCSIAELARLLRRRAVSAVELAGELLDRAEALNPRLRAFITIDREQTLRGARAAQASLDRGDVRGPLHGIPISVKDAFDTAALPTTWGAAAFAGRRPVSDAHVVRAARAAGGVLLGKANLLEFCWGPTEAHPFGLTANPWKLTHSPGGSSSGSGAAVAAGLGPASIGTDTGGSVRNPAAFCGVVGLKPTFGRIGRSGVFPLSFTLDHVGILARRVEDVAAVLHAVAVHDPDDPASLRGPVPDYLGALEHSVRRPRLLVPREHFWEHLDGGIAALAQAAVDVFAGLGYTVEEVVVPHARAAREAVQGIIPCEAAWYHARMLEEVPTGISQTFRSRIEEGLRRPAAVYVEALHARQAFCAALAGVLADGALLVVPTTPYPPYPLTDPMATGRGPVNRVIGQCTGPFNVAGAPALTLPAGFTQDGLPGSIQLVASWHEEAALLRAALDYERATEWWRRWPLVAMET